MIKPQLRIVGPRSFLLEQGYSQGDWFLQYPADEWEVLDGRGLDIFVNSVRMKAVDWDSERRIPVYKDQDMPAYNDIRNRADKDDTCQWGPEFTLTLANGVQATLWLGNPSSRVLMSSIRVHGDYVLIPQVRNHNEHTWYVPIVIETVVFDEIVQ